MTIHEKEKIVREKEDTKKSSNLPKLKIYISLKNRLLQKDICKNILFTVNEILKIRNT